jgi:beta-aspartyl-peptidase (threonine type)
MEGGCATLRIRHFFSSHVMRGGENAATMRFFAISHLFQEDFRRMSPFRLIPFALVAFVGAAAPSPAAPRGVFVSETDGKSVAEIRAVLDAQVGAWNKGDLEGFMDGYWRSPELTFTSGATLTKGWNETLARYKKRYQSEGREMGTLAFSDLEIQTLGADSALVRGQWKLTLKDSSPGGRFTLILRRFSEGWRIIHDHTS